MREIKFRAKVKDVAGWVYSDGFMKHKDGTIIVIVSKEKDKVVTSPIEENTLCEFTGLKDKMHKEIYDGDIVKRNENSCDGTYASKYEVIYDANCFCLKVLQSHIFKKGAIIRNMEECIVIGDIYHEFI